MARKSERELCTTLRTKLNEHFDAHDILCTAEYIYTAEHGHRVYIKGDGIGVHTGEYTQIMYYNFFPFKKQILEYYNALPCVYTQQKDGGRIKRKDEEEETGYEMQVILLIMKEADEASEAERKNE